MLLCLIEGAAMTITYPASIHNIHIYCEVRVSAALVQYVRVTHCSTALVHVLSMHAALHPCSMPRTLTHCFLLYACCNTCNMCYVTAPARQEDCSWTSLEQQGAGAAAAYS
jgi:hypothetical protein